MCLFGLGTTFVSVELACCGVARFRLGELVDATSMWSAAVRVCTWVSVFYVVDR